MASVVVVATITPLPGQRDAVRDALLAAVPAVHEEDGCELYALHEGDDGFVFVERWASADALTAHDGAAALAALGPRLEGKLAAAPVVTRLSPLPAGDGTKGRVGS